MYIPYIHAVQANLYISKTFCIFNLINIFCNRRAKETSYDQIPTALPRVSGATFVATSDKSRRDFSDNSRRQLHPQPPPAIVL